MNSAIQHVSLAAFFLLVFPARAAMIFNLEDEFWLVENSDIITWSYRFQANGSPNNLARDGHYELLPNQVINYGGLVGMRGWFYETNPVVKNLPYVIRNVSCGPAGYRYGNFKAKPGQVVLHPATAQIAVVSWRAPVDGRVNLSYQFSDADISSPNIGDNGVRWFVDKGDVAGNLASGSFGAGGTSGLQMATNIPVLAGDRLNFIVDPNGQIEPNIYNDSTRLWMEIAYDVDFSFERDFSTATNTVGSTWVYCYRNADGFGNLVRDGNYGLLPDQAVNASGFPGVMGWNYYSSPADGGLPMVAKNLSGVTSTNGEGYLLPGQAAMQAGQGQLVAASWLAPSNGIARVEFRFTDVTTNSASTGLRWYVDRGSASNNLASGSLIKGGDTGQQLIPYVNIAAGDPIHFIVAGDGQHRSDVARLMANVSYVTDYDFERDFRSGDNASNSIWSCRYQNNGTPNNLARDGDYELLPAGVSNYLGCAGWLKLPETPPLVLVNTESNLTSLWGVPLFPRWSLLHPGVEQISLISWRAPADGLVRADFRLADLDPGGGDGICWFVERNSGDYTLASGSLDNANDTLHETIPFVSVVAGDRLNFIIHPKENYTYDSTRLSARITYIAPLRVEIHHDAVHGVRLAWTTNAPPEVFALQVAPIPAGPWTEIPVDLCPVEGMERVWREPGSDVTRFYRLGPSSRQRPTLPVDGSLNGLAFDSVAFAPFAFRLDGCNSEGWLTTASSSQAIHTNSDGGIVRTLQWLGVDGLEITCEATRYPDFDAVEWVLYFRNTGTNDSRLLEDIQVLDLLCQPQNGSNFVLRGAVGGVATGDDYMPLKFDFSSVPLAVLSAGGGRSSNRHLPFWNLESNGRGFMFGVGWSGQWKATFQRVGTNRLHLRAGLETTRLRLHPGERIRAPCILALAYEGEPQRGQNLCRRYISRHVLPNNNGKRLLPQTQFNTAAADENLIGGSAVTETNLIDIIQAYARLGIEQIVLDAPWSGTTNLPPYWYFSAGTWTPRTDLYPRGLSPIGQVATNVGLLFGLWLEPERVYTGTELELQHPEWLLRMNQDSSLLNLGLPEARRWVINMISNYMATVPLGYFKNDFNLDPLGFWQRADAPDRQGMTEIRHIEGLYEVLDELRARFPDAVFEGCASGGRRIDLESLRRYDLFYKSDERFGNTINQNHLHGANLFLPSGCLLSPVQTLQVNPYALRSAMGSALMFAWDPRATNFNSALAAAQIADFKALRELFDGDFYPLLNYSGSENAWNAVQFHREDLEAGCALLFRRKDSVQTFADIRLQGLSPTSSYELRFVDSGDIHTGTGAQLAQPMRVWITNAPGSMLLQYQRTP